ncbi:hypothetical protein METBIDRAFT_30832 [Metschnikowia bicuspidata var. bicuspidata NRRL YB-4993]|uniref:MI domain-containing protein n=1 Tax=Metschnikowia bicuspidata var. bicuspidata NRRL YB-4993 TaxID=869754 RepID=A0A1A0HCH1_9ASCO|nr:hypothetical protein METBIDRAFT_30832 [Metschnikowia bicuspidata var. bicuspidata NRRL YB-4993]OBA21809.1 hypothetical protein METBIDRAFT_30832 [Metschnikowia bicuspidata var. bicuspidata NRRL YB-4993]
MAKPGEKHQIRMPGLVLDQIRTKEESGEYGKDARFARKRKATGKPVSRKEKRREERMLKKQKHLKGGSHAQPQYQHRQPPKTGKVQHQDSDKHNDKAQSQGKHADDEDPIAALKALKALKQKKSSKSELKIVKESELESESDLNSDDPSSEDGFDGFSDDESNSNMRKPHSKNLGSDIRIVKEDDLDSDNFSEDFETDLEEQDGEYDSDPLAALAKLKHKKSSKQAPQSESEDGFPDEDSDQGDLSDNDFDSGNEDLEEERDPLAKLKALKEAKKNGANHADDSKKKSKQRKEKIIEATFGDDNIDRDMEYYAKKLGLKNGKKSKLTKLDDDDIVGGLLDGLDLDFSDDEGDIQEEAELGEDSLDYSDDFSDDSGSEEETHKKENPFVAPVLDQESDGGNLDEESKPSKYIPPAMRRKLALESSGVSAETLALQKSIKGPINKLSEANIGTIANEINGLFLTNPRQSVNENLTTILMDSVIQQGRLLDTFVYLHSALVVAIYRAQGVDFGAHFIQSLVEKLESSRVDASKSKQALNTASLLSSVYAFQLVSSKLLYDLIRDLIQDLSESNAEILLKIIRTSGNQMRADDPGALKEIVLLVNKSASAQSKISPRMQFLIDTIASLKNNKLKLENEASHQLTIRLKKFLGNFILGKSADPLQVSLDDIRNIETKGKWWLVGSAWKGLDEKNQALANIEMVNDVLDSAEPNWLELAKTQRMNTDIRRAIFISIMSANDYIDAVTKLDKLALKKAQEREIPRIVVHCAVVEPAWNPYYGILASKLCDSHSYRKTFQFMLWDLVKGFDGNDGSDDEEDVFTGFDDSESDDDKLKKILNLGRLYGNLFAEGSLALHILRTVNFVSASADVKLFMEILLVTFLDQIAKKSQVNSIGVGLVGKKGMSEQKFDDRTLIERILKAKDEPGLLKGISHFISRNLRDSHFITGRKQRKRVEWGIKSMTDIIEEIVKETEF